MLKDFKLGLISHIDALKFIFKHKFWIYFIFPIILFMGIYYIGFYFKNLTNSYNTPEDAGLFLSMWYYFVQGIFYLLSLMFLNFIRYIIIILMSPLLSIVSERTEKILTGNTYKLNLIQLVKDVKRAINLAVRNLIWEFIMGFICIFILFISSWFIDYGENVYSFLRSLLLTLIAFYYYGFGFMDFIMERLRLDIKESIVFVRKHKGFAIALGAVFTPLFHYLHNFLQSIETHDWVFYIMLFFSVIIISFVPIFSMVAATIGINKLIDLKSNPYAKSTNKNIE